MAALFLSASSALCYAAQLDYASKVTWASGSSHSPIETRHVIGGVADRREARRLDTRLPHTTYRLRGLRVNDARYLRGESSLYRKELSESRRQGTKTQTGRAAGTQGADSDSRFLNIKHKKLRTNVF